MDTCTSNEFQIERCQAFCSAREFDVVGIYRDDGISGRKMSNRPGFQKAMLHVCKIKGVLVGYHLTRIARSIRDALNMSDTLTKCGADLAIVTQNFDTTTPGGRLFFHVMAALGQWERETTGERTKAKLRSMHEKGFRTTGELPYGWAIDDFDEKKIVEVDKEQEAIRHMVQWHNQGYSLRQICKLLSENGFEPRRGAWQWYAKTVLRIINRAKGKK